MAIGDLFKSQKEREREKERKRRRAVRNAERLVDEIKQDTGRIKKEKDKAWQDARQLLKDGQKAASQRSLQTCRAMEIEMTKLEKRRWTFDQIARKLKNAAVDQNISAALGEMAQAIEIDPALLEDRLADADDKLTDLVDSDKIWDRAYSKEMEGVETAEESMIPSFDEMQKQLEQEVAAEIGSTSGGTEAARDAAAPARQAKIEEGRSRLKKLMEETK
jgi:hypothetical protein